MIHYHLLCDSGHGFDGWFKDIAGFEKQAKRGLVECPSCGSTKVGRALMAPALGAGAKTKGRRPAAPAAPPGPTPTAAPAAPPAPPAAPQAAAHVPAEVLARLQRLRAEIERNCDYVGKDFAEEARKIHNGEAEARGIYGEATDAQAEALADDGIEVARLPWVPRADG